MNHLYLFLFFLFLNNWILLRGGKIEFKQIKMTVSVKPLLASIKYIFPLSCNQLKSFIACLTFFWPKGVVCM